MCLNKICWFYSSLKWILQSEKVLSQLLFGVNCPINFGKYANNYNNFQYLYSSSTLKRLSRYALIVQKVQISLENEQNTSGLLMICHIREKKTSSKQNDRELA